MKTITIDGVIGTGKGEISSRWFQSQLPTDGSEIEVEIHSEGGSVDFSIFYDPALAGHQALTDLVTTPAECNFDITFADAGATNCTFTAAGVGFGFTGAMNDGLKADLSLKLDQLFAYST